MPPLRAPLKPALRTPTLSKGGGYRTVEVPATVIATGADGIGTTGGWGVSTGTLSLETSNVRVPGRNVLKILANAGAADQVVAAYHKTATSTLSGNIEMWVWLPPISAGSRSLILTYSSDTPASDPPTSAPTNRRFMTIAPDVLPTSGWFCMQIHRDGKLYSTGGAPLGTAWGSSGAPDINTIKQIRIILSTTSPMPDAERYMLVDQVAINGRGRPCFMLGFDGTYSSHTSVALPLFSARNFKGYNAVDGDAAAGATAVLDVLNAAGWDIISQGIGHTNYVSNPTNLAADIVSARATLQGLGYTRALDIFAYPSNARNAAADVVAAANGIRMGAALTLPHMPASSLGKPNLVGQAGRFGLDGAGKTFATDWKPWIDESVLSGKSLMFLTHDLVTTASSGTETTIAQYTALLDYIATLRDAGTVDVLTPSQYLTRFS